MCFGSSSLLARLVPVSHLTELMWNPGEPVVRLAECKLDVMFISLAVCINRGRFLQSRPIGCIMSFWNSGVGIAFLPSFPEGTPSKSVYCKGQG